MVASLCCSTVFEQINKLRIRKHNFNVVVFIHLYKKKSYYLFPEMKLPGLVPNSYNHRYCT